MLFNNRSARQEAISQYSMSEQTLQRAKGWAIYFAITLIEVGLIDNPRQAIIGEQTLRCVAEDETNI
jgi:hypothetical protein